MVNGIAYSPKGDALVSSDPNGLLFSTPLDGHALERIDLLDLAGGLTKRKLRFDGPLFGVQWSPGQKGVAAYSRDKVLLIAPCSRETLKRYFAACADKNEDLVEVLGDVGVDRVGAAKFSADGKWMATGGFGAPLRLWDVASSSARQVVTFDTGSSGGIPWPNAFAISSEGQMIAAGLGQSRGEIRLFDTSAPNAPPTTLNVGNALHGSFVAIVFNPTNSRMLAASASDGSIFVWDDWRGAENRSNSRRAGGLRFKSHSVVAGASISSLRATTAPCACGRPRKARRIGNERQIGEFRGHRGPAWTVAISPDGEQIASGSTDGAIIICESPRGLQPRCVSRRYGSRRFSGCARRPRRYVVLP